MVEGGGRKQIMDRGGELQPLTRLVSNDISVTEKKKSNEMKQQLFRASSLLYVFMHESSSACGFSNRSMSLFFTLRFGIYFKIIDVPCVYSLSPDFDCNDIH